MPQTREHFFFQKKKWKLHLGFPVLINTVFSTNTVLILLSLDFWKLPPSTFSLERHYWAYFSFFPPERWSRWRWKLHKLGSTLPGKVHTYLVQCWLLHCLSTLHVLGDRLLRIFFLGQIAVKEALKLAREFDDIAKYLGRLLRIFFLRIFLRLLKSFFWPDCCARIRYC